MAMRRRPQRWRAFHMDSYVVSEQEGEIRGLWDASFWGEERNPRPSRRLLYPPMDKFFRMILPSYGKWSGPCPCVSRPPSWRYFPVSRAERFPRNFLAMVAALGQILRHFVWPRRSLQPAVCGYSPVRSEPQRESTCKTRSAIKVPSRSLSCLVSSRGISRTRMSTCFSLVRKRHCC